MPDFSDYEGPCQVFYQSKLLADATNCRIVHSGNGSDVNTMHSGYAGLAKGAFKSEITVENAVAVGGLEAEFDEHVIEQSTIRIVIVRGGKRLGYKAKIDRTESDNSIESAASFSWTALAGKPKII